MINEKKPDRSNPKVKSKSAKFKSIKLAATEFGFFPLRQQRSQRKPDERHFVFFVIFVVLVGKNLIMSRIAVNGSYKTVGKFF
jgi:hypothetical protein